MLITFFIQDAHIVIKIETCKYVGPYLNFERNEPVLKKNIIQFWKL